MKNKKNLIAVGALLLAVVLIAGAWFLCAPKPSQGSKDLTITVVHGDESTQTFEFGTDAEYLRGALDEQSLVAGDETEFGLYILTVDGETADEAAQQWWCITKGGEAVTTGVETTPIADGDTYEITLTTGW